MSFVFKINEELAIISVTATELIAITRTVSHLIKNPDFIERFDNIVMEIANSYTVLDNLLSPFMQLDDAEIFARHFEQNLSEFKNRYLYDVSKPRHFSDKVYDDYLQLQRCKEAKSGFPLLKRTFSRLDGFYDKWITNDNLLAMSIENAIKLFNRHLGEIADIHKHDSEDAFFVFNSANDDFHSYLNLIQQKQRQLLSKKAFTHGNFGEASVLTS